ncbi:MAG: hypothetical protein ACOYVF_05000 [Candidatus Zixiibacteriota bacterium]
MRNISKFLLLLLLVVILAGSSAHGITKVARTLNMFEAYGGYAQPWGDYDGTVGLDFLINNQLVDVSHEDLFNETYYLGFNYGTVRRGHLFYQVGFRFTDHSFRDTIPLTLDTIMILPDNLHLRSYDFDFNFNYLINDLNVRAWSPYIGVGVLAGITSLSMKNFDSENEIEMSFNLNYGLDVKLWSQTHNRGFFALSSSNSVNLLATDDKPKYFNFGLALKYYFRP